MDNWEKYVLRDLITLIIEEEDRRSGTVEKLNQLGIEVEKHGTGRKALERIMWNTENEEIKCGETSWWLNAFKLIQPQYKR